MELAVASLFCGFGVLVVADHYWVSYQVDRDAKRLQSIVSSLASSDPPYANLKVIRSTHPKAWIFGTLNSTAQIDVVRARAVAIFGAAEGNRMVALIRLPLPSTRPEGN